MKQLYKHEDKAYLILRRIGEWRFQKKLTEPIDMERVKMFRDWVGADHVLRDQTHFIFCETIPDIEFEEL